VHSVCACEGRKCIERFSWKEMTGLWRSGTLVSRNRQTLSECHDLSWGRKDASFPVDRVGSAGRSGSLVHCSRWLVRMPQNALSCACNKFCAQLLDEPACHERSAAQRLLDPDLPPGGCRSACSCLCALFASRRGGGSSSNCRAEVLCDDRSPR